MSPVNAKEVIFLSVILIALCRYLNHVPCRDSNQTVPFEYVLGSFQRFLMQIRSHKQNFRRGKIKQAVNNNYSFVFSL